jgi:hypothetical protein
LKRRLGAPDRAGALALCERLSPSWAATFASRVLRAQLAEDPGLFFVVAELTAEFEHAAQLGLDALRTLARISLPLSLGSAILVLGAGAQSFNVAGAQTALRDAVQCVTVGVATLAFCRISLGSFQRQATERLAEVRRVSVALLETST